MAVNWALGLQQGNAGDAFSGAFKQGMADNRQNMARSAMAALVANPKNERALQALASVDPQAAQQFQQQQQQQTMKDLEQFQGTIKQAAEMSQNIKAAHPDLPDAQVYSMVRSTLISMGAPGAEHAPEQFDPQYFQGIMSLASPRGSEGFTLGPGQSRFDQSGHPIAAVPGQPRYYPVPQGGKLVLDPSYGGGAPQGGPAPGAVEDGYRFKGGNPADPNSWEPVNGGQAASPPAMFP